jgi:IS5 family transposase
VIEVLIGHMNTVGLVDCNWLKGQAGDAMHVVLCAAGQNLRLILRAIEAFLRAVFRRLAGVIRTKRRHCVYG